MIGDRYFKENECNKLTNEIKDISYDDIRTLYYENLHDEKECAQITLDNYNGINYYGTTGNNQMEFFKEVLYRDPKTTGFLMEYPHGIIIRQAERNHYYRGENQRYEKSISSLLRRLNTVPEGEKHIFEFIAYMRIGEFKKFLNSFKYVQNWDAKYGTVLVEAIAQHYGLDTYWLDITNNFNTALFFATCRYDVQKQQWMPLIKSDTEKNEDTKYGYIFHIPAFQQQMNTMLACANHSDNGNSLINDILPIGFQPFERCYMQHGYGIYMDKENPLQNDISFEKLRFRHSEKLSKDIYNLMEKGSKIYPHEEFNVFDDIINIIKNTSTFSHEAFEYAKNKLGCFDDISDLYKSLKDTLSPFIDGNIKICETSPYSLSRQRRRNFDRAFENFSIEEKYKIKILSRFTYK